MALSHTEVATRRQALNEQAYYSVLRVFVRTEQNQVTLSARLRKELNVSNEQHRFWLDELRKSKQAGAAAAAAASHRSAGVNKPARGAAARASQPAQKQHKRKAEEAPQQQADMVGFKVNYFWEANRVWREGVITRFQDNKICITFNRGLPSEAYEWVKWEASDNLQMVAQKIDLSKPGMVELLQ